MQDMMVLGNLEFGFDNFSFEDYLEGKLIFFVFEYIVYLDQKSGVELGVFDEDFDVLMQQFGVVEGQICKWVEFFVNFFVDLVFDNLNEQKLELEEEIQKFFVCCEEFCKKIIVFGIMFVFQVKMLEELGMVICEVICQFYKENLNYKDVSENDFDYIMVCSRYILIVQILYFCIEIYLLDGCIVLLFICVGVDVFLRKFIVFEIMCLMEFVGNGLGVFCDWVDKIDVGFFGGGFDVEEISMVEVVVEDGLVLECVVVDDYYGEVE